MGGPGSGRWKGHRKRQTVERTPKLDVLAPQLRTLLEGPPADGTIEFRSSSSEPELCEFRIGGVEPEGGRVLQIEHGATHDDVRVARRKRGFATRWFAQCSGCNRWVRNLYLLPDWPPYCCNCAGLTHQSAQQHDPRIDLARRDPEGFVESRGRAPNTLRSQMTTYFLIKSATHPRPMKPGRGWGRKSVTRLSRASDAADAAYFAKWGFYPEQAFPSDTVGERT